MTLPAKPGLVDQLVGAGVPSAAAIELQACLVERVRESSLLLSGDPAVRKAVERCTLEAIERFAVVEDVRPTRSVSLSVDNPEAAALTGARYLHIKWSAVLTAIVGAVTAVQTELDPRQPIELAALVLALAALGTLAAVKGLMSMEATGVAAVVFWSLYERGSLEKSRAVTLEMLLPSVNARLQATQRSAMTKGDLRGALKPLQHLGCVGHLRHSDGAERWWLNDSVHVNLGGDEPRATGNSLTTG
jgi:hypothetical protein